MKNKIFVFLSLLIPIFCTCSYLITVSRLHVYYDMGINATANLGGLIFVTMPIMGITFGIVTAISFFIAEKLKLSRWKAFGLESALLLAIFFLVFLYEFWSFRNYGFSKPYNVFHFFYHFFDW